MSYVMAAWILSLVSALLWDYRLTVAAVFLTLGLFFIAAWPELSDPYVLFEGALMAIAPALVSFNRAARKREFRALKSQEMSRMSQLAQSAESLQNLHNAATEIERKINDLLELYHVTTQTHRTLRMRELFQVLVSIIPEILHQEAFTLIALPKQGLDCFSAQRTENGRFAVVRDFALSDAEEEVLDLAKSQADKRGTLIASFARGGVKLTWAPLWYEQSLVGVLIVKNLIAEDEPTFGIIVNQLALQLSRVLLYAEVESLAVTDSLTDVFVRRHFVERAQEELMRSEKHGLACALLMVDLDHFKKKNDTYGHLVGDAVLKEVASILKKNLRDIDLIARYGGEEFILMLIETDTQQALPVAERLRELVAVHPIRAYDELISQTISVGIASYPKDGTAFPTLLEKADFCLLEAKKGGRNRVVSTEESRQEAP